MGRYERFPPPVRRGGLRPVPHGRRKHRSRFGLVVLLSCAVTFGVVLIAPGIERAPAIPAATLTHPESAGPAIRPFVYCGSGARIDCVVDGDTFWIGGEKVRIAGIDTPELHPARCAEEERRGEAAKRRLLEMLNGGEVVLHRADAPDRDRYGRLLRDASVDGRDVGGMLIAEGLARPYGEGRRPWC